MAQWFHARAASVFGHVFAACVVLSLQNGPAQTDEKTTEGETAEKLYNHLFDIRNIEGWTVYINKKDLAGHPAEMDSAIDHFRRQLYQVRLNVPAPAVAIMQEKAPLWFEWDTLGIAYHRRNWLINNGYRPPDVETMAGFCRAKDFEQNTLHQPWVVFHELAHAYDHRYLRPGRGQRTSLVEDEYEQAKEAGKYDPVLCRYSTGTMAYGLNNPGEFWAENSEAYFGANDFYPFVRAELREYDPATYRALQNLWGVDTRELKRRERACAAFMDSHAAPMGWAEQSESARPRRQTSENAQTFSPTSAYRQRQIEGWTVYVSPQLENETACADEICKLLRYKLHLVKRYVPEKALPQLQSIPIWLERRNPASGYIVYHSDRERLLERGLNPDKHKVVEIGSAQRFRQWQDSQPSILLHHLARGYLDRLSQTERDEVAEAYERSVNSGKYNRVLRFDGKRVRHPALLDANTWFAEMSESYYGFNDHYPFLQFELAQYDSDTCALLTTLWGGKAK